MTLAELVSSAWSRETTMGLPEKWSPDNPATGQCIVTSIYVQRELGGVLMQGEVDGILHFWNRIDGYDHDYTISQFKKGGQHRYAIETTYNKIMNEPWKLPILERFLKNIEDGINR